MSGEKPAATRRWLTANSSDSARSIASCASAGSSYPMPGDLAGRADQVPQDRLALHDPCVLRGMDGRGRLVRQRAEVGSPADGLEVTGPLERLRDRHHVDGLAPLGQVDDHGVDAAVRLAVEVLRLEEVGDLDHRVPVDEDRPEHGLLGFDGLRGQAIDHDARELRATGRGSDSRRAAAVRHPRRWARMPRVVHGLARNVDDVWTNPQSSRRMTPMSFPWIRTDG